MIFQHTWQKVLSGEKAQTRRIQKKGDYGWVCGRKLDEGKVVPASMYSSVHSKNHRVKWARGKTYAVQPARGEKAIARIEITGMWREDVRHISDEDAKAEGFLDGNYFKTSRHHFWEVWMKMHDPYAYKWLVGERGEDKPFGLWSGLMSGRPTEKYIAWCLEFRLVSS